jgi:hypothetical protein
MFKSSLLENTLTKVILKRSTISNFALMLIVQRTCSQVILLKILLLNHKLQEKKEKHKELLSLQVRLKTLMFFKTDSVKLQSIFQMIQMM